MNPKPHQEVNNIENTPSTTEKLLIIADLLEKGNLTKEELTSIDTKFTPSEEITILSDLLKEGSITEEEFQQLKSDILKKSSMNRNVKFNTFKILMHTVIYNSLAICGAIILILMCLAFLSGTLNHIYYSSLALIVAALCISIAFIAFSIFLIKEMFTKCTITDVIHFFRFKKAFTNNSISSLEVLISATNAHCGSEENTQRLLRKFLVHDYIVGMEVNPDGTFEFTNRKSMKTSLLNYDKKSIINSVVMSSSWDESSDSSSSD